MYNRIVIKIGSGVLIKHGHLDKMRLKHLIQQIVTLKDTGVEVLVVCSGAVSLGRTILMGINESSAQSSRICAGIGQIQLMTAFSTYLAEHGYACAQILVTKKDFELVEHYGNMRSSIETLMSDEIVPVMNENDVIVTEDLVFTDNDELAGLVAQQLQADALLILSTVNGLLDGDPSNASSKLIETVTQDTLETCKALITPLKSKTGRGGMVTKFSVGETLMQQGILMHITNGKREQVIEQFTQGSSKGTTFLPFRHLIP